MLELYGMPRVVRRGACAVMAASLLTLWPQAGAAADPEPAPDKPAAKPEAERRPLHAPGGRNVELTFTLTLKQGASEPLTKSARMVLISDNRPARRIRLSVNKQKEGSQRHGGILRIDASADVVEGNKVWVNAVIDYTQFPGEGPEGEPALMQYSDSPQVLLRSGVPATIGRLHPSGEVSVTVEATAVILD